MRASLWQLLDLVVTWQPFLTAGSTEPLLCPHPGADGLLPYQPTDGDFFLCFLEIIPFLTQRVPLPSKRVMPVTGHS